MIYKHTLVMDAHVFQAFLKCVFHPADVQAALLQFLLEIHHSKVRQFLAFYLHFQAYYVFWNKFLRAMAENNNNSPM